MLTGSKSKRWAAGIAAAAALAFTLAASRPVNVAAGSGTQAAASPLATLEIAAGQFYYGMAQAATDIRSLYSIYQLQSSPNTTPAIVAAEATIPAVNPLDHEDARLVMCEIFQPPPPPKKKCRA